MLEYMLFESLNQYHSDENIPKSADSLHTSYKQIINMLELSTNDLQLPLSHKTILQVSARLRRHYQVMAVFKQFSAIKYLLICQVLHDCLLLLKQ